MKYNYNTMILKTKLIYDIGGRNVVFNRKLNGDNIVSQRAIDGCIGCANYNYHQEARGCYLKRIAINIHLLKCGFDIYNLVNWNQYTSGIIHYRYVAEKGFDD